MTTRTVSDRERRWALQTEFFDAEAERGLAILEPMDPRLIARYRGRLRPYVREEFRYALLGKLEGRHVLDLGCGEGLNSILLAKLGGFVTGVDISSKSIALSEQRARLNGLADRCRFICSPFETTDFSPASFDVVWGEAILHHLIPELEVIAPRIASLVKPGGVIVFAEPINLSPALRRLRLTLARSAAASPDDRPLEGGEIDLLRRHVPGLEVTPFRLLGRLDRLVLPDFQYERAPAWRRRILDALALADQALLTIPSLRRYASTAVLWATRQRA